MSKGDKTMGNGPERSSAHSATPVSTADVVRVVSRALTERTARLHLTAGQRRAILQGPVRPGAARA